MKTRGLESDNEVDDSNLDRTVVEVYAPLAEKRQSHTDCTLVIVRVSSGAGSMTHLETATRRTPPHARARSSRHTFLVSPDVQSFCQQTVLTTSCRHVRSIHPGSPSCSPFPALSPFPVPFSLPLPGLICPTPLISPSDETCTSSACSYLCKATRHL